MLNQEARNPVQGNGDEAKGHLEVCKFCVSFVAIVITALLAATEFLGNADLTQRQMSDMSGMILFTVAYLTLVPLLLSGLAITFLVLFPEFLDIESDVVRASARWIVAGIWITVLAGLLTFLDEALAITTERDLYGWLWYLGLLRYVIGWTVALAIPFFSWKFARFVYGVWKRRWNLEPRQYVILCLFNVCGAAIGLGVFFWWIS